jgi:TorA maturation chaperone TorD
MTSAPDRSAAADVARLRAVTYRALSATFLYPEDDRLEELAVATPELRTAAERVWGRSLVPGWTAVLDRLELLTHEAAEDLRIEYTTLFLAGARGRSCPPYESFHIGAGPSDAGIAAAAVEAVYGAAGVAVGGAAEGELPDHIAVELDFLSYLCGQEADASDPERAAAWRLRQETFLSDHLLRWLPAFERALAAVMPDGFYREAARAAREVTEHDSLLVQALSQT